MLSRTRKYKDTFQIDLGVFLRNEISNGERLKSVKSLMTSKSKVAQQRPKVNEQEEMFEKERRSAIGGGGARIGKSALAGH